jgi:pimeloyl-ACP methyl ester carboxylesterase
MQEQLPPLPPCELPGEHWSRRIFTTVGSTIDTAILRAMSFAVDSFLMPDPANLPALRRSAERFVAGDLWNDPRRFFTFVDQPVAPIEVSSRRRAALRGGTVMRRTIQTDYRPYHDDCDPAADAVRVEHWVHEDRAPRATVLALHGFSMGYPRFDAFALFAADLYGAGYDVALMTLPHHGRRTAPGARFSGQQFAVADIARLSETVRLAIYEMHVVVGWLRRETSLPVGLLGLSLGGYLSSLMAGLAADLAFVIPMVPPVCMGDLGWRFFARSRLHARTRPAAFSVEELRAALRVHSPLTHGLRIPKERALIVAGRGDQIVPPEHPHALWQHWGQPNIYWFSGSHLAPFGRARLVARILRHLNRLV